MLRRCCLWVASLCLLLASGAAADEDSYRTARVSDVTGELAARGEDEDDVSYLERNAIIRPGDVLWTDERSNAEIELERGAWVRLAEDTKLEVRELPPSAEFRIWNGSVYFDLSDRVPDPIRLRTPVGDVDVFPESVVRVDLSRDESARVSVLHGRVAAIGDGGGTVRLGAGDRLYLDAGRPMVEPERFDRDDLDGFDRYHRGRVDYYVARPLPRELDEPLIGAYELQDYGSWVVVENERYWRPRCEPDWRPYSAGYWSWVPGCGYSWIDYAPWGYTTSHYGRWLYRPVHGWLWAPRYTWGPAWVHWSSFDNYYGWAPLDPFGRPCYYGSGNGFSIGFGTGNWFIDYRSWSFCPRDRFFFGRHHRRFWDGRRHSFYAGHEVRLDPGRFRLVRDAHREFGVPRHRVRGLVNSERGWAARERVLRLEDRIPERRQRLIENRFRTPARRDRDGVQRPSVVERLQRNRNERIDDTQLVRGDDAERLVRVPRRNREGVGGRNDDDRPGRIGNDRGNNRDDRVNRPGNERPGDDPRGRPGVGRRNDDDRTPGRDRNPGERPRLEDGDGNRRPESPDRNREGNRPGGVNRRGDRGDDRDGSFRREPPGSPQPPPRPPRNNDGDRDGAGSDRNRGGTDRDSIFRRGERNGEVRTQPASPGSGGRAGDRPGGPRSDQEASRREAEQREAERRNNERRDNERRAQDEESRRRAAQEAQQRENQRRETERREAERRDNDRREAERRGNERREAERRENQRRETERRESERRDSERRDTERRGRRSYQDFPASPRPATGAVGGDDRFRRGGSYQDFPAPARPSAPSPSEQPRYRSQPDRGSYTPPAGNPGAGRFDRSVPSRSYSQPDSGSDRSRYSPRFDRGGDRPSYNPPGAGTSPSYTPPSRSYGGGDRGRSYSSPSYGGGRSYSSPSPGGGRSYSPPSGGGRSYSAPSGGRSSGGSSDRGGSGGGFRGGYGGRR